LDDDDDDGFEYKEKPRDLQEHCETDEQCKTGTCKNRFINTYSTDFSYDETVITVTPKTLHVSSARLIIYDKFELPRHPISPAWKKDMSFWQAPSNDKQEAPSNVSWWQWLWGTDNVDDSTSTPSDTCPSDVKMLVQEMGKERVSVDPVSHKLTWSEVKDSFASVFDGMKCVEAGVQSIHP